MSGVLLLAKKRSALVSLHAAIREGRVDKRYTLLLLGRLRLGISEVDVPLEKFVLPGGDRRVKAAQGGQSAQSRFTALRHIGGHTLAEADLLTKLAEAKKTQLRNDALQGAGSDRLVGLKMAEAYQGLQLVVLPSDGAASVNPLDLQKTMELFGIESARSTQGGAR